MAKKRKGLGPKDRLPKAATFDPETMKVPPKYVANDMWARTVPMTQLMGMVAEAAKHNKPLIPSTSGVKFDEDKPNLDLLSYVAMLGTARVLSFGKKKYAADNWRNGMAWRRLIRAAIGHIMAFGDGEDLDPESGLPHLDHAACCIMFLSEYQKKKLGTDDRWKGKP